jgi:hypothetical protein
MTTKAIWTLNFATTFLLLTLTTLELFDNINLATSDKDIIAVYVAILAGLFIIYLTYLFYNSIYKWGHKSRRPFYMASLLPLGLSVVLLYESIAGGDINYTTYTVGLLIVSGLNLTTYGLGLITK